MKHARKSLLFLSFLLTVALVGGLTFNVAALETWDDPYDFYTVDNTYITAKDPGSGNGNDVYQLWNTSSPLEENFTASTVVTFDMDQAGDVGQKASLVLGDDTDYEAGPQLVVIFEVFFFSGEGGKCIANFQYLYNNNWNTPASVGSWTTGLGGKFYFEVKQTSATNVHVKLTAIGPDTALIDQDVAMDSGAIDLLKNYGVATRTGFEGFTVPAGETWDDPYDFFHVPQQAIEAKDSGSGNGNDVYGIWNTSTPLTGNWTASAKVTFDAAQGDDVGQKASILLGDDTDYEAGPQLVVILEVFYFNGEGGKCIANYQILYNGNWSTPASVGSWTTGLGNEFYFEIAKTSETGVHVILKAVEPDTNLIDQDVAMEGSLALVKNYGVATRTGFETFTEMMPFTEAPVATPTEEATPTVEATPTEAGSPQTGDASGSYALIVLAVAAAAAAAMTAGRKIFAK